MKLRNVMVVITALTVGGTILVIQTGGLTQTLRAVQSFFGLEASYAADAGEHMRVEGQSATDYRWSGSLAQGASLEIKGVNGSITVELAEGDEVLVTAEARSRRSDPSSVRIERVEHAGGLTFCAVYPTPEGKRANECAPGSDGRMSTNRNDTRVDFLIRVPAGAPFIGRTVNGSVDARGLRSDVTALTVNGDIEVSTTGFARAETVNGSIQASMGSVPLEGDMEFSTVNGSIELDLPDDIDAELDANWLNGSFETDIPFLLEGGVSRRSARGVLGNGGPKLELETVNGSIRIR
ncbi:MAG: DUF4097 family beta strand repeat-containing protein [Longimicrobiales bacterium]|nr:DUF4097 family beta strand repeat-containing protein [Longimicrobiales bacterium]